MIVYFIRSLTAYKGWFFFLVIISALGGLLELVFPLGVRDLLEEGVFLQSWPVLFRKIGFLALVEGAVFLFSLLGSYYGGKLSARVENDLRMTLFRHLTHLSFAFFDYSRTGKLMATLMGDISEAGDLKPHSRRFCREPCDGRRDDHPSLISQSPLGPCRHCPHGL